MQPHARIKYKQREFLQREKGQEEREEKRWEKKRRRCAEEGRDQTDAATNGGTPEATRS